MFYYEAIDKKFNHRVFGIHEVAARDFCTYHGITWNPEWSAREVIEFVNPGLVRLMDLCGGHRYRRTIVADLTAEELEKAKVEEVKTHDYSDKTRPTFGI